MLRFHTSRPFLGICIVALALNLCITWALIDRKQQMELVRLESVILAQRDNLHNELLHLVYKVETLSALVIRADGQTQDFERAASALSDEPSIEAMLLAPQGVVSKVYPLQDSTRALLGQNMLGEALGGREAAAIRHSGRLVLVGPVALPQGGLGLVARMPVYHSDGKGHVTYWGLVGLILKFPAVLSGTDLHMLENMNLAYEIWRTNPATGMKELISASRILPAESTPGIELPLTLLNSRWYIRISLVKPWYRYVETWLYVSISLLLSLFLATLVQRNRDLTEIRKYLEAIAYNDPLTGALNRRGIFEEMARRTKPGTKEKFTLYYIDLNKFKNINDTYGHEAGDRVLQHFADTVRAHAPAAHVLGRLGGDEFVVLLNGMPDSARCKTAFAAMRATLGRGLPDMGIPGPFTFSLGKAVFPDDADNADNLLSKADTAMYRQKERGHYRAKERNSAPFQPEP